NLGVVTPNWQQIISATKEYSSLRATPFVAGPSSPRIVRRDEHHAIVGPLAVDQVQMFDEIPAPQFMGLEAVIEHPKTEITQGRGNRLDVMAWLRRKGEADVVPDRRRCRVGHNRPALLHQSTSELKYLQDYCGHSVKSHGPAGIAAGRTRGASEGP